MKIWETQEYIIVDKPYGLPTTYKNNQDTGDCLSKRVTAMYPKLLAVKGYKDREGGLLYRLDNETTGVVLFAKNDTVFNEFIKLQEEGKIFKQYIAFTHKSEGIKWRSVDVLSSCFGIKRVLGEYYPNGLGVSKEDIEKSNMPYRQVNIPIGHSKKSSKRMIPIIDSVSKLRSRNINDAVSYIREIKSDVFDVIIQKGCRHQIRVHLAVNGYPIVGDSLYNTDIKHVIKRQMMLRCVSIFENQSVY